jgi:hypothetical protein
MIVMSRLLACREMSNAAERDSHAADAGVIVGQRAQGGLAELYEVGMVWEKGVLPERSERFSAKRNMAHVPYSADNAWSPNKRNRSQGIHIPPSNERLVSICSGYYTLCPGATNQFF